MSNLAHNVTHDGIVRLEGVTKNYSDNLVLFNLNLTLQAGQLYALLGKNGSGKSTLMRIIAHREAATSGHGVVLDTDFNHDFEIRGNDIAYVAEAPASLPEATIQSIMDFYERSYRAWNRSAARYLLEGFHLSSEKKLGALSRGQLVQVSLTLQLAYFPSLILLDEVTSVLDASARHFLMEELKQRVAKGATVLLATNIVSEVQSYANSLILLGEKRVKFNAPTALVASEFVKLRQPNGTDHSVFHSPHCVEVGLSLEGEPRYLIVKRDLAVFSVPAELTTSEPITATELFVYLTRLRD